MPKSSHTQSPPHSSSPAKSSNAHRSADEIIGSKMSEVALRKKKNADAQAAFRARRANYIATLEETVTSLEAVVVQLQDSCREARSEATELRQENIRLASALEGVKHEGREREKYLRALWHARKGGSDDPHLDDFPPPPPSFAAVITQPSTSNSSLGTPVTTPHSHSVSYAGTSTENLDPRLHYQAHESSVGIQQGGYHEGPGSAYGDRSPSMPFINHESEAVGANGRGPSIDPNRLTKMGQYQVFNMQGQMRDNGWHTGVNQAGPSGGETVVGENGSATHSPAYIPSPTATSNELAYGPRYPMMEAHKTVLPGIDTVPYLMNNNNDRSISPTASSPTHTSSSASVNSHFQFVFPTEGQERNDVDYHRRMAPVPEMTLHGGTADVSVYAMNRRRPNTGPERPMLGGGMSSFRATEEQHAMVAAESSKTAPSGATPDLRGRRTRRNTGNSNSASHSSSRSPSPTGHPPISSTLAVIKAQAFGALRRTRARPKKATEGAAKMAMEVLEARGIGLGIGSNKRQRLLDDDGSQS